MAERPTFSVLLLTIGDKPLSTKVLNFGGGIAADPLTTGMANKNFIEFRCESTATGAGSDTRLKYLRLYLNGITTGGGEAVRAFTTVGAAIGAAHGAHMSLNFGASGSVSGLGVAGRNTLHLPAGVMTGTVAALQAEIWLDSATSEPPANSHGLIRCVVGGDTTNVAKVKNLLMLAGVKVTAASSGVADMVTTGCADSTSDVEIKVRINGVNYWLLATATQPAS